MGLALQPLVSSADDGTLKLTSLTVHGEFRERHVLHSPSKKPITCFAYCAPHAALAREELVAIVLVGGLRAWASGARG